MLALHTFLGSKEVEKNRNKILVDLHHICYNFLVLVPNSLPLLWSDCRSDSLVLLTFPQTKKIHFGYAWNAIWCPQTGNSLPIYMLSVGLEFPRWVRAMAGGPLWAFAGVSGYRSLLPRYFPAPALLSLLGMPSASLGQIQSQHSCLVPKLPLREICAEA